MAGYDILVSPLNIQSIHDSTMLLVESELLETDCIRNEDW